MTTETFTFCWKEKKELKFEKRQTATKGIEECILCDKGTVK